MPILSWISDHDLTKAVDDLLKASKSAKAKALADLTTNVMDPFSAMFQMSGFNMTYAEWLKSEEARQSQKSFQNFVGDFHQYVLGCCPGWTNMVVGNVMDIVNTQKQLIAEVKNKHNTVTGGNLSGVYRTIEDAVMQKNTYYKGYTGYYVTIIPKKPARFDKLFTPSDKSKGQKCAPNQLIRHIDGASFYALATGNKDALKDLFNAIPVVIASLQPHTLDITNLQSLFKKAYG